MVPESHSGSTQMDRFDRPSDQIASVDREALQEGQKAFPIALHLQVTRLATDPSAGDRRRKATKLSKSDYR